MLTYLPSYLCDNSDSSDSSDSCDSSGNSDSSDRKTFFLHTHTKNHNKNLLFAEKIKNKKSHNKKIHKKNLKKKLKL